MLPTFLFIIGVYGVCALVRLWSRRGERHRRPSRPGRVNWLALTAGTGCLLCLLWLIYTGPSGRTPKDLHLAGIIGPYSMVRHWPPQPEFRLESPAPAGTAAQPTFVLVHPETPAALILPEAASTPKPRPPKGKNGQPPAAGKKIKMARIGPAKDKAPAKERAPARGGVRSKKPTPVGAKPPRHG